MVDIHTHILPNLDDGAKDLDTSVALLREAEKQGIRIVFATPHIITGLYYHTAKEIKKSLSTLQERLRVERVDIDLIMGAEINIASEINANEISHYALNGTEKYILLELPFISYPTNCDKRIFHFKSLGLSPIIAHPERTFAIMKDPGKLREWKKRGILFQINTKSILGRYGRMVRSVALKMLKDGLADFVASDTHNQKWGFDFDDVRCVLDKIVGKQKTNELLGQNAQRLLLSKGSTVC